MCRIDRGGEVAASAKKKKGRKKDGRERDNGESGKGNETNDVTIGESYQFVVDRKEPRKEKETERGGEKDEFFPRIPR